jgi:FAD/FMN-containing dehydrogenase
MQYANRLPAQADRQLTSLIRRKFSIKCTTGYSLNALVDFPVSDPIEIIKRLMIGSEGTLGFVSRATYNTVPEWKHKASAFIVFPDVRAACAGASVLREETAVDAVELFDRCALTSATLQLHPCTSARHYPGRSRDARKPWHLQQLPRLHQSCRPFAMTNWQV